jgi:lipopolysaccharide transport system ATP-binding protein
MSDYIIKVENLGKKYSIQHQGERERYVALRDVIARGATAPLRWIAEQRAKRRAQSVENNGNGAGSNGRAALPLALSAMPREEEFWALRGVSFEVKQGEVVGIIGRNGAGKSTLLKILSQITEPTEGRVRIRGRVASLLEVGTGFHPELTGRENIFVNGAILGMTRAEIAKKFDEIVAFAEIEKFLDTPVKRYSSGMYVRLAFAVAAHLEPEILIVDEVLAVGDVEFQKKCLGKMSEVARGGRTVLFVSHNMAAISGLTARGIVFNAGQLMFDGPTDVAIEHYIQVGSRRETTTEVSGRGTHTVIRGARLLDEAGESTSHYTPGKPLRLDITLETDGTAGLSLEAFLLDSDHHNIAVASLHHFHGLLLPNRAGSYRCLLNFEPIWLASGAYSLNLTTSVVNSNWDHYVEGALKFSVDYSNPGGQSWDFKQASGYGAFGLVCQGSPQFIE